MQRTTVEDNEWLLRHNPMAFRRLPRQRRHAVKPVRIVRKMHYYRPRGRFHLPIPADLLAAMTLQALTGNRATK